MRIIGAAILATSLIASSTFAATSTSAPLAPGKPAGVKKAAMSGNTGLIILGLAVIGGGIALIATGNGHSTVATTTNGTAP